MNCGDVESQHKLLYDHITYLTNKEDAKEVISILWLYMYVAMMRPVELHDKPFSCFISLPLCKAPCLAWLSYESCRKSSEQYRETRSSNDGQPPV